MNFSKCENNFTVDWKYIIIPILNGHFNPASDTKFISLPLLNFYQLYFLVRLVMKYKAQLEPVHILELNAFGDLMGNIFTKMVINYDPYVCESRFYNCEVIHFINYVFGMSLFVDLAIGKNLYRKDDELCSTKYHIVNFPFCFCVKVLLRYLFLKLGEINRFLHIYWSITYIEKVDIHFAYKTVIISKLVIIFIAICVAYGDPNILKCDNFQSYICNRKKTAPYVVIPLVLSMAVIISVSLYFVKKVYGLAKVHPTPVVGESDRNMGQNSSGTPENSNNADKNVNSNENVGRRMNRNPNQPFRVRILNALEKFTSSQETSPMFSKFKKALIVNLVSLCQMAFLLPLHVMDILLLLNFWVCDNENFSPLAKIFAASGILGNIFFPICLEKKLDKFCLH